MRFVPIVGGVLLLAGCAGAAPLSERPELAATLEQLEVPSELPLLPNSASHRFDLADGLDATEAAILAVANNPGLKAARAAEDVARAQSFSQGLLPWPVLSGSLDLPDASSETTGYQYGAEFDLASLIGLSASRAGGRAEVAKARLDVLWEEWQVAEQARTLHRKLLASGRRIELSRALLDTARLRQKDSAAAMARGDVTLDVAAADDLALIAASTRWTDEILAHQAAAAGFRVLLGLDADAPLPMLQAVPDPEPPSAEQVQKALGQLAMRRPDLRALAAGYAVQDAKLRGAILNRVPNLRLLVGRARDTGGILTTGIGLSMAMPFLDGNQGVIRVEKATAEQLRLEYASRLAQADSEIRALSLRCQALREGLAAQISSLDHLNTYVRTQAVAVDRGDLEPAVWLSARAQLLDSQFAYEGRAQDLAEGVIALCTLLAMPIEAWEGASS